MQAITFNNQLLYIHNLSDVNQLAVGQSTISLLNVDDEGAVSIVDSNDYSSLTANSLTKSQVNKVKADLIASIGDTILIHNLTNNSLRTFKSCSDDMNPHSGSIIHDLDWNPKVSNVIATGDSNGLLSIFDLKVKKPTLILNKSNKSFLNINSISHVKFDNANALNVMIQCDESDNNHQRNVLKLFDLRKTDIPLFEIKNKKK